jgi:hypothetical protein
VKLLQRTILLRLGRYLCKFNSLDGAFAAILGIRQDRLARASVSLPRTVPTLLPSFLDGAVCGIDSLHLPAFRHMLRQSERG